MSDEDISEQWVNIKTFNAVKAEVRKLKLENEALTETLNAFGGKHFLEDSPIEEILAEFERRGLKFHLTFSSQVSVQ
jgi:hypothetical protein